MIQKLRVYLLGILALFSMLFLAILRLHYYSIIFPVLFGILGMILFIAIDGLSDSYSKGDVETEPNESSFPKFSSWISFTIFTILFLIFFSLSFLTLFQGDYTKSIAYYICISLCAGILILEVFMYRTQIQGYGILLKAVLLSINVVFANHLIFINGISLPDFGLHMSVFIMSILNTGHISTNPIGSYEIFSIHHIFASEITMVTGDNPFSIYLFFGSFMVAIGVLFVFIIGKRFVNFQFGLVTAVLFTCLDYYLMYGEHPEHQAYNLGFALVCFTAILFTYRSQKIAFYVLFAVSTIALTFSHHLTAALVFVTACSLIFFDTVKLLHKKDRSFPSKYIALTFIILLFIAASLMAITAQKTLVQLVFDNLTPYLNNIFSLLGKFLAKFSPVISVPPTPVISVPPTPVISVPVSQALVSPTAYDKLPFVILFENTLGSSLLILAAMLGFCSFIKKRSWFGDITVLNGVLLSILLLGGVLFSYVLLLPDRIYPVLQIFCMVFLGAAGILWLHQSVHSKNRSIIVGCICILVVLMSFFSLASIINGFETSPFTGDSVAYPKLYTTDQDVSFGTWSNSFLLPDNRNNVVSAMSDTGIIKIDAIVGNHFAVFDNSLLKTGVVKSGGKFGQHSFTTVKNGQLIFENSYSSYYDNGLIVMMNNNQ